MYSAGEAAQRLKVSKDTLRYYEKEGLLPPIGRDMSGHRTYTESDVQWIYLIRCLRDTDMPIERIKQYISLLKSGGSDSITQRRDILREHLAFLHEKMEIYRRLTLLISKKLDFYDEALSLDRPQDLSCMDYAAEWEHFRTILGGLEGLGGIEHE